VDARCVRCERSFDAYLEVLSAAEQPTRWPRLPLVIVATWFLFWLKLEIFVVAAGGMAIAVSSGRRGGSRRRRRGARRRFLTERVLPARPPEG
jgi:hypothetical protein